MIKAILIAVFQESLMKRLFHVKIIHFEVKSCVSSNKSYLELQESSYLSQLVIVILCLSSLPHQGPLFPLSDPSGKTRQLRHRG